jgi:hypothetical protein
MQIISDLFVSLDGDVKRVNFEGPPKFGRRVVEVVEDGVFNLSNGSIHLGINYLVLNETKQNELGLNTKDFRLVNCSFNTRNICSKIGQIVTDL